MKKGLVRAGRILGASSGASATVAFVDEAQKSGYELRQERYRESNVNKKARDLDQGQKRKNKRSQAY